MSNCNFTVRLLRTPKIKHKNKEREAFHHNRISFLNLSSAILTCSESYRNHSHLHEDSQAYKAKCHNQTELWARFKAQNHKLYQNTYQILHRPTPTAIINNQHKNKPTEDLIQHLPMPKSKPNSNSS